MSKCGVCDAAVSKYRCPVCRVVRYCSVECYRVHKRDNCKRPTSKDAEKLSPESVLKKRKHSSERGEDVDDEEVKLTDEAYGRIVSDEKFKKYFLDKRFQKVVQDIDSAPNRRIKLQQYIDNDIHFRSIVDEMLILLDFASKNEKGNLVINS